jgi:hypothetical protein
MVDKTVTIKHICEALLEGRNTEAKKIARNQYPFQPLFRKRRNYSLHQSMQVFVRDGFIDRYSGQRLIFPGVLRLLSIFLPDEFPFQKNWKMTETHIAYWELYPTIDHVVPIARGGNDDKSNWVTTSMLRNTAKSNWTLSELGILEAAAFGAGEKMIIRVSAKLGKKIHVMPTQSLSLDANPFADWSAHIFTADRTQYM